MKIKNVVGYGKIKVFILRLNCSHCQTVKKSKNEPFKGKNWRLGYMAGIKEERKAFTMGLRCMHCGEPKEDNPLSDMCHSCFESA